MKFDKLTEFTIVHLQDMKFQQWKLEIEDRKCRDLLCLASLHVDENHLIFPVAHW
jgi:hypothetical protein